ncbi:disease resistance protein At4g27190-like [Gastrolobium bilobum]|uniref:disease resistance protein At4g27190-like n=1 Tax=Gastrolobium bilobum TaxID=150636 RepID=UPI002AB13FFC|nr:disease resistance protein At4g27190-like [Gastrolobium bilobum]
MECASKIVEKAIDVVWDLSFRHLGYIWNYRENVNELKERVKNLGLEKERVKHQVDEAGNNMRGIESKVRVWLEKVDKTITDINEKFQNNEDHTKTRFFNLRNRHRLGRKAKKMAADVKLLIDESRFDGVSYQQNPTSIDAILSNVGYMEFGSRKHTMEQIMEQLEDSAVRMIGVYGPGGVGKSTLIKEIAKEAKKLFSVVAIAEVTDNPRPQNIQEVIAYVLGLTLEEEDETVRADRLRRRLKKEKENTLVILDDLWDKLDLNKLGIPFDDDDDDDSLSQMTIKDKKDLNFKGVKKEKSLGDYKGCKILLTSRDKKVLSEKMDVKLTSIFCVRELDEKDALVLFKKVAGISDEMSSFKQEIVKKYCAGLPMAIVTVGRALRNKSESVWATTLEKLKKQELMGVQKSMEISVKISYDHLESEELKSIFLLCAQMGHQPLIMDLVKYCFGLGILQGVYALREARDRIYASIQKLKDSSLLLDGSSSDNFKMHDMVQDAALSIAHKEQNVFTLRNGKVDDWPDEDELERCTAISIHDSDIIELPKVINFPQLKFFQIASDDPSLKIPENFFEGMKKLRVLILNGIHLPCLPSSIKSLLNLTMLCLERCTLVHNLSIIGELKKLRILSFSGSQIQKLPAELECLVKLQLLDISQCSIGKGIPPNIMSSLKCLEELYIRKSLMKIEEEGETNQSHKSFLSELEHLHQLKIVDLCIPSAVVLPRNLLFDKLDDYKILIGDFKMLSVGDFRMPNKYEALRSLALQLKDDTQIHSQIGIKLLFGRVENLLLGELNGVKNVFYELNLDGFPYLKHLSIINNGDIEYIIKSMELSQPQDAFPNLESLCLYKLSEIKMICCSPVTDASFSKLKTIKVKMCTHLKNLFSFYMVKFLASLETIDVSESDSLEEIVIEERQVNSEKVEFHKLRSLKLQSLPLFTSFYTKVEKPSAPQLIQGQTTNRDHTEITIAEDEHYLFSEMVEVPNLERLKLSSIKIHKIWRDQPLSSSSFQNLIKLTVEGCHNLEYLCSLSVASRLEKLKGLFISDCRMMKKIFSIDGNSEDKVCIFPKLEEIRLTEMNMLTDIWQAEVIGADSFSSLISVHIVRCRKLDKIFPSHMKGWFRTLNILKVVNCKSVEVIFEGILNFKNLRSIGVFDCDKLSSVLPASVAKDLEKLEYLLVMFCDGIMEIVAGEDGSETSNEPLVFPEVTRITLCYLEKIKRFYMGRHTIECPKLKQLTVVSCDMLQTFTTETTNEEGNAVFSAEKVRNH